MSGETTISKKPGDSATIEVILYNLDFGGTIKGASVTYRWQYGERSLTDPDNNGVYSATENDLPEGTFIISIYAFLGDNYDFELIEIVLSVVRVPTEDAGLLLGLLIAVSIGAALIAGYFVAYQRVYKFPKAVRKVRKYRKSLKRKSTPSVHIIGREAAFKSHYNENLGRLTSDLKLKHRPGTRKPMKQKITPDKPLEQKMEPDQLTEKAVEKREELDKILKDSLD